MDFWSNGQINRASVESVTDGYVLELCFEAAIVSDEDDGTDSECEWDDDDWIMRKRRCAEHEFEYWNPRGRNL